MDQDDVFESGKIAALFPEVADQIAPGRTALIGNMALSGGAIYVSRPLIDHTYSIL